MRDGSKNQSHCNYRNTHVIHWGTSPELSERTDAQHSDSRVGRSGRGDSSTRASAIMAGIAPMLAPPLYHNDHRGDAAATNV